MAMHSFNRVCEQCEGKYQRTSHYSFAELVPTSEGSKWLCHHCKVEQQNAVRVEIKAGAHCWCRRCFEDRVDGFDYGSGLYKLGSGLCFDCFNARVDKLCDVISHNRAPLRVFLVMAARGYDEGYMDKAAQGHWVGDAEMELAIDTILNGNRHPREEWEQAAGGNQ